MKTAEEQPKVSPETIEKHQAILDALKVNQSIPDSTSKLFQRLKQFKANDPVSFTPEMEQFLKCYVKRLSSKYVNYSKEEYSSAEHEYSEAEGTAAMITALTQAVTGNLSSYKSITADKDTAWVNLNTEIRAFLLAKDSYISMLIAQNMDLQKQLAKGLKRRVKDIKKLIFEKKQVAETVNLLEQLKTQVASGEVLDQKIMDIGGELFKAWAEAKLTDKAGAVAAATT